MRTWEPGTRVLDYCPNLCTTFLLVLLVPPADLIFYIHPRRGPGNMGTWEHGTGVLDEHDYYYYYS